MSGEDGMRAGGAAKKAERRTTLSTAATARIAYLRDSWRYGGQRNGIKTVTYQRTKAWRG